MQYGPADLALQVERELARARLGEIEAIGGTQLPRLAVHVGSAHREIPVLVHKGFPHIDIADPAFVRMLAENIIEEIQVRGPDILGGRQPHPEHRNALALEHADRLVDLLAVGLLPLLGSE